MTTPGGVPTCYRHPDRETYISCQRCGRPICPDCMREAAVGFHCPTCVAEGAKETRSGRTAYGGRRPSRPGVVSMVLIGLNLSVWLAVLATGWARSWLVDWIALSPIGVCGSEETPGATYPLGTERLCATSTDPPGDGVWIPGVADGAFWSC